MRYDVRITEAGRSGKIRRRGGELNLRRMIRPLGLLVLLLVPAAGCGDAVSLVALRQHLSTEFHNDDIGVTLTDGLILTVTVVDPAATAAPCERLAGMALEVAASVRRNYPGFDTLQTVGISFADRDPGNPRKKTTAHLPFRFSQASLLTGRVAAESASAVELCRLDDDHSMGAMP